ncbi:helix-turn-helix domain-containing protein [Microbacterium sp. P01]|uniref:helix-turn-helix domain-containing protein n=1 Tax=Microbacterium sp. P01 TaxID=3366261 RepID=UPI00366E5B9E
MRFKVVVTRVETVERWVPAADEDSAMRKVEEELRRPFAFVGQWETQAAEVRVVEAAQTAAIQPIDPADPPARLLALKDAARSLGISYSTLYNLVRRGEVEHTKVGSRYFMSRESIDLFIRTNTTSR